MSALPRYVNLYLEKSRVGSGARPFLVLREGHKWTTLLYLPSLTTVELANQEFDHLMRARGRELEYKPARLIKQIREASRFYETTNAVRDALALLRAEPTTKANDAPKEEPMASKVKKAPRAKATTKKAKPVIKANGHGGKFAEALASAGKGTLPEAPPFKAAAYKPYLGKLAELKKLVKDGDITGLKNYPIPDYNSIVKALDRYRNLAVIALQARGAAKAT